MFASNCHEFDGIPSETFVIKFNGLIVKEGEVASQHLHGKILQNEYETFN